MEKLLSIIVPSYNMEKYLPKCLGSLIVDDAELLQKLDVIVVNDGSKDRTSEIAHDFERRYPGVFRVIDKPNGHYGSCINAALPVAKGEFVKVLDADDWFVTPNLLAYLKFIADLEAKDAQPQLLINDFDFVDGDQIMSQRYSFVGEPGFDLSKFDFQHGKDLWMHAVAYRTQMLRDIGYKQLPGITHTDVQWLHLPMSRVERIGYFPHSLYEYQFRREGNTSDAVGFYRTFHDLVAVTKELVEESNRLQTAELSLPQQRYLLSHVRYHVMRVYNVYLLERSPLLKLGILEVFDEFLSAADPKLYAEFDGFVIGNRFKFRYIHDWRRRYRISWKRKMFDGFRNIYTKVKRVVK